MFCTSCFALENDNVLKSETGFVKNIEYTDDAERGNNKQIADVVIKTGMFKGQTVKIENVLTGNPYYDILLKKKDNVILHLEQADDGIQFFISDIKRVQGLYFLLGIFVFLVVLVGRKKGGRRKPATAFNKSTNFGMSF